MKVQTIMSKKLTTLLVLFLLLLGGCAKAPVNSDVEGFWQLKKITYLSTDETVECSRLYYSITRMVTEVSERQGTNGYGSYIGRTEYRDDETKLVLKDFKVRSGTGDNGENAPVEDLRHYGIDSQEETVFLIEHCDGKTMTLKSDYARLELKKF